MKNKARKLITLSLAVSLLVVCTGCTVTVDLDDDKLMEVFSESDSELTTEDLTGVINSIKISADGETMEYNKPSEKKSTTEEYAEDLSEKEYSEDNVEYEGISAYTDLAEEANEVTMANIVRANSEDILSTKNYSAKITFSDDMNTPYYSYITRDYIFTHSNLCSTMLFRDDSQWQYVDDILVYDWYAMDEPEMLEDKDTFSFCLANSIIDPVTTLDENIESIEDNGDDTLTVETTLDKYGEKVYLTYKLEKDTLCILSMDEYTLDSNGDKYPKYKCSVEYGIPEDDLSELSNMISKLQQVHDGNERQLKIIYDAGTDNESTYEMTAKDSYKVSIITKPGYHNIYTDKEGTELFTGSDGKTDVTVYVIKDK